MKTEERRLKEEGEKEEDIEVVDLDVLASKNEKKSKSRDGAKSELNAMTPREKNARKSV